MGGVVSDGVASGGEAMLTLLLGGDVRVVGSVLETLAGDGGDAGDGGMSTGSGGGGGGGLSGGGGAAGTTRTYQLNGLTDCQVEYTSATAIGDFPDIVVVDTGC